MAAMVTEEKGRCKLSFSNDNVRPRRGKGVWSLSPTMTFRKQAITKRCIPSRRISHASQKAYSAESMGEFWLREFPKLMVQSHFRRFVGPKTVGLSHTQFDIQVEPLHYP